MLWFWFFHLQLRIVKYRLFLQNHPKFRTLSIKEYSERWCGFMRPVKTRGRILGRHPKSLKSFPPCYSQAPLLRACLEISISSNSRNLLQTLHCKAERRKTWQKTVPSPYGLRSTETSSLSSLKIMPRNLNEITRSWIRLQGSLARERNDLIMKGLGVETQKRSADKRTIEEIQEVIL